MKIIAGIEKTEIKEILSELIDEYMDAVTLPLMTTTLTDASGNSLGTALDLVARLEKVRGKVKGQRGDRQFRTYVKIPLVRGMLFFSPRGGRLLPKGGSSRQLPGSPGENSILNCIVKELGTAFTPEDFVSTERRSCHG